MCCGKPGDALAEGRFHVAALLDHACLETGLGQQGRTGDAVLLLAVGDVQVGHQHLRVLMERAIHRLLQRQPDLGRNGSAGSQQGHDRRPAETRGAAAAVRRLLRHGILATLCAVRDLLHQGVHQRAAGQEFRLLADEVLQQDAARLIDEGNVYQVDHQPAVVADGRSRLPGLPQFRHPGAGKLAFQFEGQGLGIIVQRDLEHGVVPRCIWTARGKWLILHGLGTAPLPIDRHMPIYRFVTTWLTYRQPQNQNRGQTERSPINGR